MRKSKEEIEAIAKEISESSDIIIAKHNFKNDVDVEELSKLEQKAVTLDIKTRADKEIREMALAVCKRYDLKVSDLGKLYKSLKRLEAQHGRKD